MSGVASPLLWNDASLIVTTTGSAPSRNSDAADALVVGRDVGTRAHQGIAGGDRIQAFHLPFRRIGTAAARRRASQELLHAVLRLHDVIGHRLQQDERLIVRPP